MTIRQRIEDINAISVPCLEYEPRQGPWTVADALSLRLAMTTFASRRKRAYWNNVPARDCTFLKHLLAISALDASTLAGRALRDFAIALSQLSVTALVVQSTPGWFGEARKRWSLAYSSVLAQFKAVARASL